MRSFRGLARILLVLLFADTIFMVVSLFKGNVPLIYIAGTILVLLFLVSFFVIQNSKKNTKNEDKATDAEI